MKHLIIPDTQVKPGVPTKHLEWVGNYIAEKRPDTIVMIGDFADMPSLSSYDKGTIEIEGKRVWADIAAARLAMDKLTKPFLKIKNYNPRMILTLGNHEDRITRYVKDNPELEGTLSVDKLGYADYGWTVYPFKKIVRVNGIEYAHYFESGPKGNAIQRAVTLLNVRHSSAVMGHNQLTDIAFHPKTGHVGILAGTCYLHEEKYLGPQMAGKAQRRQIIMLHEIRDNGIADPMFVSLNFLKAKYS